jgi:methylenetetrahydrofolate dehydrogenase (NADP+)/methenyltetrahydrofolate cyclohydrolase
MILDGKVASEALFEKLRSRIDQKLSLTAIQVGDNPASTAYINLKRKKLEALEIGFNHIKLEENVPQDEVSRIIQVLNDDAKVSGILLQLPLPDHMDSRMLLDTIAPEKDPDCLNSLNLGRFFSGVSKIFPATPLGVVRMLEYYNIPLLGKKVTIIGRSNLVGKPLSIALTAKDATVTLCHSKTQDIKEYTLNADIVITAVGNPGFFTKDYFKEGQTAIDVGISKNSEGKIQGDVDYENVSQLVEHITPVPGGIGPMTIYSLIENLVNLNISE